MLKLTNNLVCIRHPKYDGMESPDLTCKVCCSKFVNRIRAEQKSSFEATWNTTSSEVKANFEPMNFAKKEATSSKRQTNFDEMLGQH